LKPHFSHNHRSSKKTCIIIHRSVVITCCKTWFGLLCTIHYFTIFCKIVKTGPTAYAESSFFVRTPSDSGPGLESRLPGLRTPAPDCRCKFTSASSECFNVDAGHYAGWPSLAGGCGSSMERSSAVCSFCAVAAPVPSRPEDGTAPAIILHTLASSCVTINCYCQVYLQKCKELIREVSPKLST